MASTLPALLPAAIVEEVAKTYNRENIIQYALACILKKSNTQANNTKTYNISAKVKPSEDIHWACCL
jgi:hypothetical protein